MNKKLGGYLRSLPASRYYLLVSRVFLVSLFVSVGIQLVSRAATGYITYCLAAGTFAAAITSGVYTRKEDQECAKGATPQTREL